MTLSLAASGAAQAAPAVGWRGDGTGVFPNTSPPTTWSRVAKNSIVARMYCSATKPAGDAVEGAAPCSDGIPRNWMVLGPFDGGSLDAPCVPDEAALDPGAGAKVDGKEWKPYNFPTEVQLNIDNKWATWNKEAGGIYNQRFLAAVGGKAGDTVYAHTFLYSPRDGKVRMYMAHDKGLKIWVNGKEAWKSDKPGWMWYTVSHYPMTNLHDHRRFLRGDGAPETFADLELKKGWNRVMVKAIKGGFVHPVIEDLETIEYETKNVLWTCKLPEWGMCGPIVVGDRVFVTCEPDVLICVDRKTGKILWQRTNSYVDATPQEERDANPLFKEKILPLYEKLQASTNEDEQANLRHEIQELLEKVSVDKYPWQRVKSVCTTGFAFPTPASDGKNVYFVSTLGVASCYDLDGNRKWIKLITAYGEHGKWRDVYNTQFWNLASPLVVGDTLYINRSGLAALDKNTGREKWYVAELYGKGWNKYEGRANEAYYSQYQCSSPLAGKIGDTDVVIAAGGIVRASDGTLLKLLGSLPGFGQPVTPVLAGSTVYMAGMSAEMSLSAADTVQFNVRQVEIPGGTQYLPSPLYCDGLLYIVDYRGMLIVVDAKEMTKVYSQQLPMSPLLLNFTVGVGASPAIDGQTNIYVMDNQGVTVVFKAGREYRQVAVNTLEHFVRRRCLAPQQESLQSCPFIDGGNIFIRSEENLYCIGTK